MPPTFLLHLVVLAWSLTAILGKLITLPATDVAVWRTGMAAIGFAIVAKVMRVPLSVPAKERRHMLIIGWFMGWHWLLFFLSSRLATASVTLAAMPAILIICSLAEPLVNGTRRWRKSELLVGMIIMGAVSLIYKVEPRYWLGFTVALASAALASVFALGNKQLSHRYPFAVLCFWQMCGACTSCLVALPFVSGHWLPMVPAGLDLAWLLVLSQVCTVAAYAGYIVVLRQLSVFTVNVTYNLEPVYGIVLAALIFGQTEHMSTGFYLGAAIIVGSVLALPWFNQRTTETREPPAMG
jgi:drug/metabolite transporter (DMT)-like permease